MLILGEFDFIKHGRGSVGVKNQYPGTETVHGPDHELSMLSVKTHLLSINMGVQEADLEILKQLP
jgi:hypothetical protein